MRGRGRPWGDGDVDRAFAAFLAHYEGLIGAMSRFYPGARETVEALRAAGWVTGICTNKPARLAEMLMARLSARGLFDSLVGSPRS